MNKPSNRTGGVPRSARRSVWAALSALALLMSTVPVASAADAPYLTPQAPFIELEAGVSGSMLAIINSGDTLGDFTFEGIPDGVGIRPGQVYPDTIEVYVSHEQSTVPFRNNADFEDASVSVLTLSTAAGSEGAVVASEVAIPASAGFLRFCSAFMAGPDEGFEHYTYFANEESNDIIDVPLGAIYDADPGLDGQRQAGYAVALRTETNEFRQIEGLGRYNHENTIALPGYSRIALLSTDDTFSGPSAQLYMYLAASEDEVWDDKGSLWAFQVTDTDSGNIQRNDPFNGANDYLDLEPGEEFSGQFIRVPKEIANGDTGIAPQQALEDWSNENNVFQFIRLEDLAYDQNDPHTVYIADTGRSRVVPDSETGRLVRGPSGTVGSADNGRMFVMEFNEDNPRKVDSFYVLAQGDDPDGDVYVPFVSPDNVGTSVNSLMVQEDADSARIWQYDLDAGTWGVVATVTDEDSESSGIADASEWFGPGAWLLTVQAHGTNESEEVIDGVTFKREDGQVLLMTVDGS